MVNATINGKKVCVEEGTTILQAARQIDIKIPTLCHNPDLPAWASCGICIVRMAGTAKMIRACCTAITEGMNVITHDPQIVQARRTVLELILSNHRMDCLSCVRSDDCELRRLAHEYGVDQYMASIMNSISSIGDSMAKSNTVRNVSSTSSLLSPPPCCTLASNKICPLCCKNTKLV